MTEAAKWQDLLPAEWKPAGAECGFMVARDNQVTVTRYGRVLTFKRGDDNLWRSA